MFSDWRFSDWRWRAFRVEHPSPQEHQERGNADILTKLTVGAGRSRRFLFLAHSYVKEGS